MRIRFFANMRTLVGIDSLEIDQLEGRNTLRNLLSELSLRFPVMCDHLFDEDGNLRQDVPIFIDGRNPRLDKEGLDVLIASDAEVSFFSPISSGRMNVEVLRNPSDHEKDEQDES